MSADGSVDLAVQGKRQSEIANRLYSAVAGEPWERLEAYVTQAGEFTDGTVVLSDANGVEASRPVPAAVLLLLIALRDEMWDPQTRPWCHVQVSGTAEGEFRFFVNYERRFDLNRRPLDRYSVTEDPAPSDADLIADLDTFARSGGEHPGLAPDRLNSAEAPAPECEAEDRHHVDGAAAHASCPADTPIATGSVVPGHT